MILITIFNMMMYICTKNKKLNVLEEKYCVVIDFTNLYLDRF